MKPILRKALILGTLGLGIYVKGCSDGHADGFNAGQQDVYHVIEHRVKTINESFTSKGLEEYIKLNLATLQAKDHASAMNSPEQRELIASFLALNQKYNVK